MVVHLKMDTKKLLQKLQSDYNVEHGDFSEPNYDSLTLSWNTYVLDLVDEIKNNNPRYYFENSTDVVEYIKASQKHTNARVPLNPKRAGLEQLKGYWQFRIGVRKQN